jgi:hypothetical protein
VGRYPVAPQAPTSLYATSAMPSLVYLGRFAKARLKK